MPNFRHAKYEPQINQALQIDDPSRVVGPGSPIYIGTWDGKPAASTLAEGTRIIATDISNQGNVEFQVVGGAYRLCAATVLYLMEATVVGLAQTAEQGLFATPGLQRSVLEALRYYSVSFVVSKSAGANTFTNTTIREGNAVPPLLTDTAVFVTSALMSAAANRSASGGILRKYNSDTARTQNFNAAQNSALEQSLTNNAVWPSANSSVLTDALVFETVTCTISGVGDVPALERIMIVGY